jgi:tetratricopeptide (TPR) repeat protein
MRTRTTLVFFVAVALSTGACGQFEKLKARKVFKEANALYQQQNYKGAAEKYEETVIADPELSSAYFYLGNSYDNQFKTARRGEAENDAFLEKAIQNYKLAVEREQDPKMKKLSLEYLVSAYGPDKLNDPSQAEPIVQEMIKLDPSDPANYFVLAKIYEDSGNYDLAEGALLKAKEVRPNDSAVYLQLAGYYNRQGEFDKTIEALNQRAAQEPNNPEAHYTIASYYWDKAYRDFKLQDAEKRDYVLKGIDSVNKALEIKNDYLEAVVYKGLLLRLQANLEKDVAKQQALLKEAEALQGRVKELQKNKAAGV